MGDQYFSELPSSSSDIRTVTIKARGINVSLQTDAGVFSKRGLDFGTRQLIEHAELTDSHLVVDLGCGYGAVTAILARVYPDTQWIMLDVNQRAVALARRNVEALAGRVEVHVSDGFSAVSSQQVDAVLLNPPIRAGKAVVYRLFEEAYERLATGGQLWVVIQKKQGAPSTRDKLESLFGNAQVVAKNGGYYVLSSRK